MKKAYTVLVIILLAVLFYTTGSAQLLLKEDFSYVAGTNLNGQGNWVAFSNTGTNPIQVTSPGLTYTCYLETGIDNAVTLQAVSGEDCRHALTAKNSGSVYASAMIKVTADTSSVGDYVLSLGSYGGISTLFNGRLFVRQDKTVLSGFNFGISKVGNATSTGSAAPVWSPNWYIFNQTYLVVLKYKFVAGATNDSVFLYINPDVCGSCVEPSPTLWTTDGNTGTDVTNINSIFLLQGTAAQMPNVVIDGIRVDTVWCDVTNNGGGAPCPVELSSFACSKNGRDIHLNWETKTEKNSNIFEIERYSVVNPNWIAIGSVKAAVLSNSSKYYSYTDTKLQSGKYQYRLKMVDNDGSFAYSSVESVEIAIPKDFAVSQNYPNPFNPTTKIDYQVPVDAKVLLEVYNIAGQKVSELVNQEQLAGYYSVDFGASKLSSGVYIYRVVAIDKEKGNNFSAVKKMMLLK